MKLWKKGQLCMFGPTLCVVVEDQQDQESDIRVRAVNTLYHSHNVLGAAPFNVTRATFGDVAETIADLIRRSGKHMLECWRCASLCLLGSR